MYIRNQNILNPNFKNLYKSRGDCERTHSHMKRTFNFSMKWIQNRSKEFYAALNFIAYQTVLIADFLLTNRISRIYRNIIEQTVLVLEHWLANARIFMGFFLSEIRWDLMIIFFLYKFTF